MEKESLTPGVFRGEKTFYKTSEMSDKRHSEADFLSLKGMNSRFRCGKWFSTKGTVYVYKIKLVDEVPGNEFDFKTGERKKEKK